jgi:formamidopyrimidine-DNA glycosylase
MPELPEVETIVRGLRAPLIGRHISAVKVCWKRTIAQPSAAAFERQLPGLQIVDITRRAKYLVFELRRGNTSAFMLIHLRMSGRLDLTASQRSIDKHDRVVFDLDDGRRLHFNDTRKFGRIHLTPDPLEVTAPLGPEPLGDDFTPATFKHMLMQRSGRLKPLLLDQKFIAGLGNIYVDEALWLARLHPLRGADTLNDQEMRALYHAIRRALRDGIQRNGASIDGVYPAGEYQNHFRVYDRAAKPCRRCKHPIRRIVVGQRGTYFCAHCQPERG